MKGDTIIGVPFEAHPALRSLLQDGAPPDESAGDEITRRLFKIRSADTPGQRGSASVLINRMYAHRGYLSSGLPAAPAPTRITLVACEHEHTIGTITIEFDSPARLLVDELFAQEAGQLRAAGRKLCEFTKLAMDSVVRSKRVLASLFHVAYIYAHRIKGHDDLLIEVNPRHVRYYENMLAFTVAGPARPNPRVNAPAVLMRLDFALAHDQIERFGGRPQEAKTNRSLYPLFFSVAEEAGIVGRLKAAHNDALPPPGFAASGAGALPSR